LRIIGKASAKPARLDHAPAVWNPADRQVVTPMLAPFIDGFKFPHG